jgi:hypothetical protein
MKESLQIATEKFKSFGFNDAQIEQLLTSATQDIKREIEKLYPLLESDTADIQKINQSLHALKGLLYNMGNTEAGDKMAALVNDDTLGEQIADIKKILHL